MKKVSVDHLQKHCGQELASSDWMTVTQDHIDRFSDVTGDDQWIHVDAQRAASSPFGGTIAHGFLTLSLLTSLLHESVAIEGVTSALNYGLNRVRFVTPVRSGSRIRARFVPVSVESTPASSQVVWGVTVDLDGSVRPACVAEWIVRYLR